MAPSESLPADLRTAEAFATSWNNLPGGSVYSFAQFEDWMAPLERKDFEGKEILELGCGNASLLEHATRWNPASLTGVDLGGSVVSAEKNMKATGFSHFQILKDDLTTFRGPGYDVVYCIGVLHHLKNPLEGLRSVVANVKPGGRFHCWVYAHEGNALVRFIVEPMRKIGSVLPWWMTKYLLATPLVAPYFFYAKILRAFKSVSWLKSLPLFEYSCWIAERDFAFFRHVAFDQLVTPQTMYATRQQVEAWMAEFPEIEKGSEYVIFRNGNSWKFGGKKKI